MPYAPIIGLEIHVQLKTASKMFCACPNVNDGEAEPNTAICPVCTGQPGALPALNRQALELAVRAGLALHCRIPDQAKFDRKNYFYPDLPKGYQISEYEEPVCAEGWMEFDVLEKGAARPRVRVGITRAHLEEDAAKNQHAPDGASTLVDYNRASTPLLEIVTDPDFRSAAEAKAFLQELRLIMRRAGVSDAEMEKGQMRCDANVSLMPINMDGSAKQKELNARIEIKNINSFRAVERAIEYEVSRQTDLYETNTPPLPATRGWDENKGITTEQRTKEGAADYRYFPEPDLPPVNLVALRDRLTGHLPEMPDAQRHRIIEEWGFSEADARVLVGNEGWADYAEKVLGELGGWMEATDNVTDKSAADLLVEKKTKLAKLVGGWLTTKLFGLMTEKNLTIKDLKISAENFAEFLNLILKGDINSSNGQRLLSLMVDTGTDPSHLMEEHNLGQNMDENEVRAIIKRLIDENPKQVEQFKAGKENVLMWFVGSVMKASEGRANPEKVKEIAKGMMG